MAKVIEAKLRIDAQDRTAKAFKAIDERLKKAEAQTKRVSQINAKVSAFESAGVAASRAMLRAGGALGLGLSVAGAGMAVTGAIKDYAALERQMTRIGLAAGATDQETKAATADVAKYAHDLALPMDQAVAGLDALVATGKSMPEAMAFLPSILRTAQATGAATDEMAQSAAALATSMKVPAEQMQSAFDALVVGGQLGQFEMKDMARYLPSLTASAAKLGYTGEDGVKRLVAMLQTVRQVSGTSEEAATAVRDSFEKLLSPTVANAFKKHGVNIGKVLVDAGRRGENQFDAVIGVLDKLTKGMDDTQRNLLISSIFTEADSRRAIVAMMTMREQYEKYRRAVDDSGGATEKNLQRVLGDTQAAVDRLAGSWGRLWTTIGRGADSAGASTVMEGISGALTGYLDQVDDNKAKEAAIAKALEGKTWWERKSILARSGPEDLERLAKEGGYVPSAAVREAQAVKAQKDEQRLKDRLVQLDSDIRKAEEAKAGNRFAVGPGVIERMQAERDKLKAALDAQQRALADAVPSIPGGAPLPRTDPRGLRHGDVPYPLPDPRRANQPAPVTPSIPYPIPDPRGAHTTPDLSAFERVEQDRLPPLPEQRLEHLVAPVPPPMAVPVRDEVGAALKGLSDINDRIRAMYAPPEQAVAPPASIPAPSPAAPQAAPTGPEDVTAFTSSSPAGGPLTLQVEDASLDALRVAMESAGPPIEAAGASAGQSILDAARALADAASRIGEEGRRAAEAISAVRIQAPAMPSAPRSANANLGQSMPTAGTPGG